MARSRKTRKSTDKAEEGGDTANKIEDTVIAAEKAATETVDSEADSSDAVHAEETPEATPDEIVATDEAIKNETVEGVTSEDSDLGSDTLLTENETDLSSEAEAANLEETPDEAQDETLLEGASETEETEQQDEKPEAEPERATTATSQQQSSSFWPAIFGGLVAAALGFIAGRGDTFDSFLPGSMQRAAVDLTELEGETAALAVVDAELASAVAALAEAETALQARIGALESLEPVVIEESVDTSAFENSVSALESALVALADRVTALEDRPVAAEPDDNLASTDDIAALQTAMAAQQAEIEALSTRAAAAEAEAASEARRILARAALTRVETAVDTGQSFAPALQDLEESTAADVPDALRSAAETGVPTLSMLQESFPEAARAGLAAARAEVPESEVQGIGGFLRRTLNARSTVPREGDDPDAILSRAEAALRTGDLETALMETDALPDAAKAAMGDWLDSANARKSVQDAASELANSLNSN